MGYTQPSSVYRLEVVQIMCYKVGAARSLPPNEGAWVTRSQIDMQRAFLDGLAPSSEMLAAAL